jgi:(R,R)-butanediol dehydrogenase/meso-butanediol dehydrogenase/diacetyl reductase
MLAARLHGNRDLRVEEVDEPEPGPGQVKLAVAHNGLCGTDLHEYFDGPSACTHQPHPLTGGVLPQIMGHEFSGTVAGLGEGVAGLAIGDEVSVATLYFCGACHPCRAGLHQLCEHLITHGICSDGGGMAEFTVVPSGMLHPLPSTMTLSEGALVEPLSVAFNAVLRSRVEPGQTALVLGAGPIGIGIALGMRAIGVDDVIVVEPAPARRRAVEALGFDSVIDPEEFDLVAEVRRRTAGRGVDAVLDSSGAPSSFLSAPAVLRPRGRYVVLSFLAAEVPFAPWVLARSEIELTGSCGYDSEVFARVIALIDGGSYPTDGWVEHAGLDDVVEVLDDLRAGKRMKVLVDLH